MNRTIAAAVVGASLLAVGVVAVTHKPSKLETGTCSVRLRDGGVASTRLDDAEPGACIEWGKKARGP